MRKLPRIKKICENCGKEFEVPPYHSYVKNCSKKCGQKSQGKKMIGNTKGFQKGHEANKERWQSEETKEKISKSMIEQYKSGQRKPTKEELHGNWKGEKACYSAIHTWVRKNKPKPELCERCNKKPPYDLANISGECKRDINDYEYLCRKCHMKKDGRTEDIKKYWNPIKGKKYN